MIIQKFDNGWGNHLPLKKFEQHIVDTLLRHIAIDQSRTVVINSVWYFNEYHQQVLTWLRNNSVDRIVLVAMLDQAIPQPLQYSEFDCEILTVGYYPGDHFVDAWAVYINEFLEVPNQDLLMDSSKIDTAYMCLNRKPHLHRQHLYQQLNNLNLLDCGIVSMGGVGQAVRSLTVDCEHDNLAPNAGLELNGIPNDIVSLGHMSNWNRHFVNVVTETMHNINQAGFVSEKIYKPIIGCRPFLVYDTDGGTRWLQDRGFEPYVTDFLDLTDLDLSLPENLPTFLAVLCEQTPKYWQAKYLALSDKILYNKHHFTGYVSNQWKTIKQGIICQV
jgi:hypothetical protein